MRRQPVTLVCLGFILIAISIPLYLGKIKMNRIYGFRIRKAFESEENWYEINRYRAHKSADWRSSRNFIDLGKYECYFLKLGDSSFSNVLISRGKLMPPVFLNGVRIPEESTRAFINAVGPLNETCVHCGGSVIETKSVVISSQPDPVFRIWCATCGRYGDLRHELPGQWYRKLVRRLEMQTQRIF
jgi:hypothetical protein